MIYRMRVPPLVLFVFFPWGIPQIQSDWSLSCDHGLDYASLCEHTNTNIITTNNNNNSSVEKMDPLDHNIRQSTQTIRPSTNVPMVELGTQARCCLDNK